ncbi:MAG: tetratricopeptide repeat protein [Myxococcaceae bacterium]
MYNLVLALALGIAVTLGVRFAQFPWIAGIIPGTITFFTAFVLLGRRVALKVQAISGQAQQELSVQVQNPREQKARIEKAIKTLESALVYSKWQFLVGAEVYAQIGMIKYMVKDFDGAKAAFAKANPRNYMSQAMQGALHYQRKAYPDMEQAFEHAVKSGKKEGIVWSTYAWCLQQIKEKDKALKVMARAVEANPSDEKLKAGLTALQNDKKLKMKPYEPMWWQFGLENPPLQQGGGRQVRFQRR